MVIPIKKKRLEPASELTDDEDKVFLIYEGQNFEQSRKKLSKFALFFGSLFSREFSDSRSKKLYINYENAKIDTFKSFLTCVNSEQPFNVVGFSVNESLKKYIGDNFEELLELFQLASFFLAVDLLNCLSYITVSHWFNSKYVLVIWLMIECLPCEGLLKAAFAMCLDIFESIPKDLLFELPIDKFEMLITNPNIRCSETYFKEVVKEWAQKKNVKEEIQKNMIFKFQNAKYNKRARYLQCVTGFATNSKFGDDTIVFDWDGNELEELSNITDGIKPFALAGSQILGRGYSIYVVGGEKCIGNCLFNEDVARYCLLTEKWYKVARLKTKRRHMVAAFLGNQLVLVGGVGLNRIKLSSVHILDIHTGTWSYGPHVPQEFNEFPPACVFDDQLVVAMSGVYSYKLKSKKWKLIWQDRSANIKNIVCCNKELYVTVTKPREATAVQIYIIGQNGDSTNCDLASLVIAGITYNCISIDDRLIFFLLIKSGELNIQIGEFEPKTSYRRLQRKSVQINDKIRLKPFVGCFNILNPKILIPQLDAEADT